MTEDRQKTIHIIWVHFKILENVNKSKVTGSWSVVGWLGWEGEIMEEYKKRKNFLLGVTDMFII